MKIAHFDGDGWVYRCGFAAEHSFYLVGVDGGSNEENKGWVFTQFDNHKDAKAHLDGAKSAGLDGLIWSRKEIEPLENCLQMVKSSLENTLDVLKVTDHKIYLSGRRNFREDVYSDYKANRDSLGKPKYYRDIRQYLISRGAIVVDGLEADDALGIAQCSDPASSIIVSVDKDLDQIPGEHYDWVTGESYSISAKEGLRFFYEQLLSGDTTDNIPGIYGIGPAKAKKALAAAKTPSECADIVFKMYTEHLDPDPRELIDRNAKLLWIWRKEKDEHPFWKHLKQ